MIFKPSEVAPLCALKLTEILIETGLPPGFFNVVQGMGAVGAALTTDPRVAKVSLTGSVPMGRRVHAVAGMKYVTIKTGGKSPVIVFTDAGLDDAVSGAILGNFCSSGQVCSSGTRVFLHRTIRNEFLARLCARLDNSVIGDPQDPAISFGPMISNAQLDITVSYVEKGKAEGGRLVCGGGRIKSPGFFMQPTVFADVTDDMIIAREEIFVPVMAVLDFDTEEEVLARSNETEFVLAAGVSTRDLAPRASRRRRFRRRHLLEIRNKVTSAENVAS